MSKNKKEPWKSFRRGIDIFQKAPLPSNIYWNNENEIDGIWYSKEQEELYENSIYNNNPYGINRSKIPLTNMLKKIL